ncbi:helix-turn-helix domain-containing protein [Sulfurovum riftiae]|uniref:XRE family transcriptional regulator n=1 Tax=Sulfurovum riftiae TaxID=1630136 RepID=A0A151CJ72_9BACT|nr:helix-turn-helix transcriptional regulator [Sulfurovum riftiae]KYJ87561.1 XRE family transcriptional regulator [Sulfurovum riftiae]
MSRTTLKNFKEKAFQKQGVQDEYDALRPEYAIKKKLIAMRKEAGLTQEKLAEIMGTKKSNISRLESFKSSISPRIETLIKYAEATGHELKVDFV